MNSSRHTPALALSTLLAFASAGCKETRSPQNVVETTRPRVVTTLKPDASDSNQKRKYTTPGEPICLPEGIMCVTGKDGQLKNCKPTTSKFCKTAYGP